jgi:hypothetical protein
MGTEKYGIDRDNNESFGRKDAEPSLMRDAPQV